MFSQVLKSLRKKNGLSQTALAKILGVAQGTTISIIADGSDEVQAVDTLCELINSDFEE